MSCLIEQANRKGQSVLCCRNASTRRWNLRPAVRFRAACAPWCDARARSTISAIQKTTIISMYCVRFVAVARCRRLPSASAARTSSSQGIAVGKRDFMRLLLSLNRGAQVPRQPPNRPMRNRIGIHGPRVDAAGSYLEPGFASVKRFNKAPDIRCAPSRSRGCGSARAQPPSRR